MTPSAWFDDLFVLGQLPPAQAAIKLREAGEDEAAARLEEARPGEAPREGMFAPSGRWWPFQDRPWQHTAHAFGYLAPAAPGDKPQTIQHGGNIDPDLTLKNARIKITLDRLRVADYPGWGTHRILF